MRAFDVHAAHYLLKPFATERPRAALQRFLERSAPCEVTEPGRESAAPCTSRIVFKSLGRILFLCVSEIQLITAEKNYVRISTPAETHLLRETMGRLEVRLDPESFLHVRRSSIMNLRSVREMRMDSPEDASVILVNDREVSFSHGDRSRIQRLIHC